MKDHTVGKVYSAKKAQPVNIIMPGYYDAMSCVGKIYAICSAILCALVD